MGTIGLEHNTPFSILQLTFAWKMKVMLKYDVFGNPDRD